uniref:Uncharacterized protein n=1 Tax=Anguilla anguilla TaxID=7936 RepID=A0A0E9R6C8_ANGAN
MYFTQIYI